jgi:predicted tellurium resistance membrane protein TerC
MWTGGFQQTVDKYAYDMMSIIFLCMVGFEMSIDAHNNITVPTLIYSSCIMLAAELTPEY